MSSSPLAKLGWKLAHEHPLALIFVSAFGFASQSLCVKLLVLSGFGVFETIVFRALCQGTGVAVVLLSWGEPCTAWLGRTRSEHACLFGRGMFGFGGIALAFLAIRLTTMANAATVQQVSTILSGLLGFAILGEPWRVAEMIAMVTTVLGVVLIFRPDFVFGGDDTSPREFWGLLSGLGGAFSAAGAYVLIRYMGTKCKVAWPKLMLAQAVAQFFCAPVVMKLAGEPWQTPTGHQLLLLLACGVLGFLSQVCMTNGMQNAKSSMAGLTRQSGILFTFSYQVLLVPSEKITTSTIAGAATITLSLVLLGLWKHHQKQKQEATGADVKTTSPTAERESELRALSPDNEDAHFDLTTLDEPPLDETTRTTPRDRSAPPLLPSLAAWASPAAAASSAGGSRASTSPFAVPEPSQSSMLGRLQRSVTATVTQPRLFSTRYSPLRGDRDAQAAGLETEVDMEMLEGV